MPDTVTFCLFFFIISQGRTRWTLLRFCVKWCVCVCLVWRLIFRQLCQKLKSASFFPLKLIIMVLKVITGCNGQWETTESASAKINRKPSFHCVYWFFFFFSRKKLQPFVYSVSVRTLSVHELAELTYFLPLKNICKKSVNYNFFHCSFYLFLLVFVTCNDVPLILLT